ncbi:MAG: OmpA family protein [Deltaproteobacteria bacterium]|nr:OmpA family protein [Deltaproteobacteria bacterium]
MDWGDRELLRGVGATCLLLVLAAGCTHTETTTAEVPAGPATTRLRPVLSDPTVQASWSWGSDGRALEGKLAWASTCAREVRQELRTRETTTTESNVAGNVTWLVLGLGVMGGSAATLFYFAGSIPDETAGQLMAFPMLGFGIGGLGIAAGAVAGLARATETTSKDSAKYDSLRKIETPVACGTGSPEGLELAIEAWPALERSTATVAPDGTVRFELPDVADVDASKKATIKIANVPGDAAALVTVGDVLGEVSIEPYAKAVAEGRRQRHEEAARKLAEIEARQRAEEQARVAAEAAARREADQQEFEGVVHGDPVARSAFSTECAPEGADVCFDAIDNDCDGLYDIGCGYRSGALQWTLAWKTGDDLDLHVIGPDGVHVFFRNRQGGRAGLELDVDCLGDFGSGTNCPAQNVENIFSPPTKRPMEGTYRGWVQVFQPTAGDDGRLIEAMLGGRLAGKSFRMPLRLVAQEGERIFFAFAIGKDSDRDGVVDREDACPGEAGVFSVYARESGCPDRDMDGVADRVDRCRNEAGLREGVTPDRLGCPRRYGQARLTARGVEIDAAIQFGIGSAVISPASYGLLRDIASVMREQPAALRVLSVEGHTDSEGDDQANMLLSRDRVKSVLDHLALREGIDRTRLRVAWFGEYRPIASNDLPSGRAKNRRVELRVVDPPPQVLSNW